MEMFIKQMSLRLSEHTVRKPNIINTTNSSLSLCVTPAKRKSALYPAEANANCANGEKRICKVVPQERRKNGEKGNGKQCVSSHTFRIACWGRIPYPLFFAYWKYAAARFCAMLIGVHSRFTILRFYNFTI